MTSPSNRIVVIGNAGIDSNVYLPGADIDFRVEGNFTKNLDTVGQAGGYSARGYAALGRPTAFIGHVVDVPRHEAYPAATWQRLAAVKALYDPQNLFRHNHNVPPAAND